MVLRFGNVRVEKATYECRPTVNLPSSVWTAEADPNKLATCKNDVDISWK